MTIPINALDEAKPAGGRAASLGDNDIREYKTQNREILEVNHVYPSSGQSADAGKHKMVHLIEQADLGTGAEGKPILGAQTVSGKAELLFTDEDNNDVQITSGGRIRGASVRLANDVSLTGRNQANSADVDIIKVNTSNQAQVTPALIASGGLLLPEISAPTTIVDQGALYTKNDGSQTELYFKKESNGSEVKITSGGSLSLSGNIVIGQGTAAHGTTIPYPSLPAGKSSGDYTWYIILSVNDFDTSSSNGAINKIDVRESSRVVTCTVNRYNWVNGGVNTTINGVANYMIIGV